MGSASDPITLHRYVYAGNDAVQFSDPGGREFSLADVTNNPELPAPSTCALPSARLKYLQTTARPPDDPLMHRMAAPTTQSEKEKAAHAAQADLLAKPPVTGRAIGAEDGGFVPQPPHLAAEQPDQALRTAAAPARTGVASPESPVLKSA